MESFGGTKPYLSDFEIADDLAPDPFSEEPIKTMRHAGRESLRAENLKQRKTRPETTDSPGVGGCRAPGGLIGRE